MLNWYLIYTKQRQEDLVACRLQEHGLEVFNPKLTERKTVRRKAKEVTSALFPNYLFAKFDPTMCHRLVKYAAGVRKIVGFDDSPTPVDQSIIDSIENRIESGELEASTAGFVPGEEVEVRGGPFYGLGAVFLAGASGMERVSILLKEIDARVVIDPALLHRI
ncbi:MAG: hypothetical protein IME99_09590 [Proteobacteria bacterium]|nr:hypothetical protein [Pseudomonadota bacterium]